MNVKEIEYFRVGQNNSRAEKSFVLRGWILSCHEPDFVQCNLTATFCFGVIAKFWCFLWWGVLPKMLCHVHLSLSFPLLFLLFPASCCRGPIMNLHIFCVALPSCIYFPKNSWGLCLEGKENIFGLLSFAWVIGTWAYEPSHVSYSVTWDSWGGLPWSIRCGFQFKHCGEKLSI